MNELAPADYQQWLSRLKVRILSAQQRAALAVNQQLISLYWQIGNDILQRQHEQGWGSKVIDRLARDLRQPFPEMKGFSRSNLLYMRSFSETWPDFEQNSIVQQAVGQIPWGHNLVLLSKVKKREQRLAYAQSAQQYDWSRNVLVHQIESCLLERQGNAATNFVQTLPAPHSELALQTLKAPYVFDFLSMGAEAHERISIKP
jgi:predicted nuclease of restriction endonuclease-like (RecB) superfamily